MKPPKPKAWSNNKPIDWGDDDPQLEVPTEGDLLDSRYPGLITIAKYNRVKKIQGIRLSAHLSVGDPDPWVINDHIKVVSPVGQYAPAWRRYRRLCMLVDMRPMFSDVSKEHLAELAEKIVGLECDCITRQHPDTKTIHVNAYFPRSV
jgi:hypothetical protein